MGREREGEGCVTGEALTRNSFVNPEGARRLIHWHCSRDPPPRMQTQSLQRVTREMIDEGIGEKVAQSNKKKKNTEQKESRKKKERKEKKAKSKENHLKALKHNFSGPKTLGHNILSFYTRVLLMAERVR